MSTTSLKTMVLLMALFISSSQSAPINEEQTNEGIVVIPSLTIDATSSSVYSYEEYSTVLLEVSPSPTPSPSQLPTATPTMSTVSVYSFNIYCWKKLYHAYCISCRLVCYIVL